MSDEEKGAGEILDVTAADGGTERLHMPPNKRILLIICAAAAVILITAAAVIGVCAKKACVKPVKTFFSAVENADGKAFADTLPPCVLNSMGSESAADYYEENMLRESLKELEDDYGSRIRLSFKEEQRIRLDDSAIERLENKLRESYGEIEITKAYDLDISYTIKGSHKSETKRREFTVCKTEGKWVIAGVPNSIL